MAGEVNGLRARKQELRREILGRRRRRSPAEISLYADTLATAALAEPRVAAVLARRGTLAAYVGIAEEPGTLPLLDALHERGVTVLLPVMAPQWRMEWAAYTGADALVERRVGAGLPLLEPGPSAARAPLDSAEVILLPGLAIGPDRARLGRGGGAYDRALAELSTPAPLLLLLYPDEVGLDVPTEAHDLPVDGAIVGDVSGVSGGGELR